MGEYISPKADLIVFANERIITVSGCECHYDITQHNMALGGEVECDAESGGAHENPFGISAPDWRF